MYYNTGTTQVLQTGKHKYYNTANATHLPQHKLLPQHLL